MNNREARQDLLRSRILVGKIFNILSVLQFKKVVFVTAAFLIPELQEFIFKGSYRLVVLGIIYLLCLIIMLLFPILRYMTPQKYYHLAIMNTSLILFCCEMVDVRKDVGIHSGSFLTVLAFSTVTIFSALCHCFVDIRSRSPYIIIQPTFKVFVIGFFLPLYMLLSWILPFYVFVCIFIYMMDSLFMAVENQRGFGGGRTRLNFSNEILNIQTLNINILTFLSMYLMVSFASKEIYEIRHPIYA